MPASRQPTAASVKAAIAKQSAIADPLFEVRRSPIQGRGVFAIRQIRKGKRITEYLGEPITHEEADRRYDDNNGRHHTFLFILDDDTVLDARSYGSDARYINHSCDPNCETLIDNGHIWINAIKPIAPETELTYDYRFEWQDQYDAEDVRYYACRCGTAKCRGTILRVPVYLRPTVRRWLAGEDVRKPRKPRKKPTAKKAAKTAAKKDASRTVKKTGKRAGKKTVKKATKTSSRRVRA